MLRRATRACTVTGNPCDFYPPAVLSFPGLKAPKHNCSTPHSPPTPVSSGIDVSPTPYITSPLAMHHGIEVGHAFHLGTKYSEVFQCRFKARDGTDTMAEMGCYGLGLTRILQAIVCDDKCTELIIWDGLPVVHRTLCLLPGWTHTSKVVLTITKRHKLLPLKFRLRLRRVYSTRPAPGWHSYSGFIGDPDTSSYLRPVLVANHAD